MMTGSFAITSNKLLVLYTGSGIVHIGGLSPVGVSDGYRVLLSMCGSAGFYYYNLYGIEPTLDAITLENRLANSYTGSYLESSTVVHSMELYYSTYFNRWVLIGASF